MFLPNAAGTITSGVLLDRSITDTASVLPTAVPDGLLLRERFMPSHILCFCITDKFVLSLSRWPLLDNLTDVLQPPELGVLHHCLGGQPPHWAQFSQSGQL